MGPIGHHTHMVRSPSTVLGGWWLSVSLTLKLLLEFEGNELELFAATVDVKGL